MAAMRLNHLHQHILRAMSGQGFLKVHRDIEGNKICKLHALDGGEEVIPPAAVAYLVNHGLIDSNKKFPAATYWLTPFGTERVKTL